MNVDAITAKILDEIKSIAKTAWDSWTDLEKALVMSCARDSVTLMVRAAAGEDVAAEKRQITAQLANIKVAALGTASQILWNAVINVFLRAVKL